MARLILFNKPFRVLSQFTDSEGRKTLADFVQAPGCKVAGRLDYDSEGLLLLTDDGLLQQQIANPRHKAWKTYWVQVEGNASAAQLRALREGLDLNDGPTLPAKAHAIDEPMLWPRVPAVRVRQSVPDCWLEISIREGRNRQVRRMTAAVGLPTLRLVRSTIGNWALGSLLPGEFTSMEINMPAPPKTARGKRQGRPPYRRSTRGSGK